MRQKAYWTPEEKVRQRLHLGQENGVPSFISSETPGAEPFDGASTLGDRLVAAASGVILCGVAEYLGWDPGMGGYHYKGVAAGSITFFFHDGTPPDSCDYSSSGAVITQGFTPGSSVLIKQCHSYKC